MPFVPPPKLSEQEAILAALLELYKPAHRGLKAGRLLVERLAAIVGPTKADELIFGAMNAAKDNAK